MKSFKDTKEQYSQSLYTYHTDATFIKILPHFFIPHPHLFLLKYFITNSQNP